MAILTLDDGKIKVVTGIQISNSDEVQADTNKMVCLLDELIKQMRILNLHMECVTGLENAEEEVGDHPLV